MQALIPRDNITPFDLRPWQIMRFFKSRQHIRQHRMIYSPRNKRREQLREISQPQSRNIRD